MKVKKLMIAMLVSVPCFVATSVIATATPNEAAKQESQEQREAAKRQAKSETTLIESTTQKKPEPPCIPWQYC